MKLSEIFEIISNHFEVSKEVLYQGFVHDNYFRKFIKSIQNSNTKPELLCKEIIRIHYLFTIDFYRNRKNLI